jgi:hypothetical protein
MFTAQQYRARADEYAALLETARSPAEFSEYRDLQRSFASLAENLEWMTANAAKTVSNLPDDKEKAARDLQVEETEHPGILSCLGAAMILNWNTIPAKLQRSLFEDATDILGETGGPSKIVLAQYLHDHKNDARPPFSAAQPLITAAQPDADVAASSKAFS